MVPTENIRNLAIGAHIDHGKTTLIDAIFRATRTFRKTQHLEERVMDTHELERERGITIRSKHCTVEWGGYLINIIDTPGHADFSGEVERVLSMADSVLLVVDADEGPMPQTRYVLMRALRLGLRPIVVLNKVDRASAAPDSALDRTFDLFIELGASDAQTDFPVIYGSALHGWMVRDLATDTHEGLDALLQMIVDEVPAPTVDRDAPFRMQVSTLAWNDHIGRIGCGRVLSGSHRRGEPLVRTTTEWRDHRCREGEWDVIGSEPSRSTHIFVMRGLDRLEVDEIEAGDIVWISGPEEITIGDTLSSPEVESPALAPLEIEQPTVSMFFLVNSSPLAGADGNVLTLREIKDRLARELRVNVALRVEDIGRADGVKVSGRGELHLGILIEEMRRENIELCVSRPEVITRRNEDGQLLEPMEQLTITCAAERLRFGSRMYGIPSRFLEEIPASVVERAGGGRVSRRDRPVASDATYDYSYAQSDPGEGAAVAPGLRVRHPHFGAGVILSVAGSGPSQKLKVNFERAGVKTLVVKYANLELG